MEFIIAIVIAVVGVITILSSKTARGGKAFFLTGVVLLIAGLGLFLKTCILITEFPDIFRTLLHFRVIKQNIISRQVFVHIIGH